MEGRKEVREEGGNSRLDDVEGFLVLFLGSGSGNVMTLLLLLLLFLLSWMWACRLTIVEGPI